VSVELARQQWEDGARRLQEATRDPVQRARLLTVVDVLVVELRRRLGGSFTLEELAAEYEIADRWTLDAVAEAAPVPGWQTSLSDAGDMAFQVYSRGAIDYAP
jgi:hypothetical protein